MLRERVVDVAVVGGGAAGLSAAIFATEEGSGGSPPLHIVVYDGTKTIGAKILISGGGRCNITHEKVTSTDFFGNRHIIKNVLAAFPVEHTVAWFASMGVHLKREDTGKLFPITDKAKTVLHALVARCRERGVDILTDHRIMNIECQSPEDDGFILHHRQGSLRARSIVMATGGRSLPKSGSDGFGYDLARRLGHSISPTSPALVPLVLDDRMFHRRLTGISQDVQLTAMVEGKQVDRRTGSLLWTHFGISGPVVMDVSRFWTLAKQRGETVELLGNFFPELSQEGVGVWFKEQAARFPRRTILHTLTQRLPERFAEAMCGYARCNPMVAIGQCPRPDRNRLLGHLTRFCFSVERERGWNYAEVTRGGIPLDELDYRTMESRIVPGLYFVGEILDCDGRIGGFNFQWAWATGYLAGRAIATRGRCGAAPGDRWNLCKEPHYNDKG